MKRLALALGTPMILIIGARPAFAVQNAPAFSSDTTVTPWWHYAVPAGIIALALLISARMIVRELRRAHRADAATVELATQLVSMSDAMVGLAAHGGRLAPTDADAVVTYDDAPAAPVVTEQEPVAPTVAPAPVAAPPVAAASVAPPPQAETPEETAQFAAMHRVLELDHQRRRMHSELDWPSDDEIERFRTSASYAADESR
jgi:hypothetical protein